MIRQFIFGLVFCSIAVAQSAFVGRWNFNIDSPGGNRAAWLGIAQNQGTLEVRYQPTGGNVIPVKDAKIEGNRLILPVSQPQGNRPGVTWELEAKGDRLEGVMKRGDSSTPLVGVRAPELKRSAPKSWSKPEPLFNGKDLTGWEPVGNPANSHWVAQDGMLVNEKLGANLKTTGKYDDFKLHFEVMLPEHTNSGMYLRGRYEVQLEVESGGKAPPERKMGSIYGRIAPQNPPAAKPGEWQVFDVTFVGRTLTVVQNGVTIIDRQEVEGITGGALDANEGEPGPFYIQGDHAGGVKFRNMTISVPKR